MVLSVIIVNYNVRYFLELCLQSVQDALVGIDSEIIVVDNNSDDDSCIMLAEKFPEVKVIANKENYGFAKANNQAVSNARGQYVLILNPDTVVTKGTFKYILNFAKSRNNFGALGVKLIGGDGQFLPESKRGIPTPLVSLYKLSGFSSRKTGKYYANHLKEDEIGVVDILVGAFMFMSRKIYNEVGGFDESYFMYGEDIDLSYKILKKGYQNYYYPDCEIIHYKGECTIRDAKRLGYFHESMRIFYKRYFKLNKIYDFVMNLGINFWYLLKAMEKGKKEKLDVLPNSLVYCGKNIKIYEKLESLCGSKTKLFWFSNVEDVNLLKDFSHLNNIKEIVFDNNSLSYSDIISNISTLKNEGFTFKIHPKNTNYIIGSNHSKSRGSVFVFED